MKDLFKNKYIRYSLVLFGGIFLGWLFFHSSGKGMKSGEFHSESQKETIWTCAMHPQIRMNKPGKCPICGMDLIPLNQNGTEALDPDAIQMTKEAAALANVITTVVSKQKPVKEIRLYGKVQADESTIQTQVAHLPGRIEKLMVNFTGESIRNGQILASIYSPQLVTAQQELLEAAKLKQTQPAIYEASKEKLRQWKISEAQIDDIEKSGMVKNDFDVISNTSGIVLARKVNTGDYVSEGTQLYDLADLSQVWVMFDAYESDLSFLKVGDRLSFTVQAIPGYTFSGKIAFIDPVLDPNTRVAKVRVEIRNESGRLKPEMFATGIVDANLEKYRNDIIIPRSAVLWTGKRSIVYVKQQDTEEPVFKLREIELGPMLGNSYVVTNGLTEGEEVVTQGTFSVDAAAQLEGKPSMMNTEGNMISSGHNYGGMKMEGNTMENYSGDQGTDKKKMEISDEKVFREGNKLIINSQFREQLTAVYKNYLSLKDAFVKSDGQEVALAAGKVKNTLNEVDMKLLEGETHMVWMDQMKKLLIYLEKMIENQDINIQREAFAGLNLTFYQSIKDFGLEGVTTYYQYCPMAIEQKGAYWFSEVKEIKNPYFGKAMLKCGETSETLKY